MIDYNNDLIRQYFGQNPTAAYYNVFPEAGGLTPLADFIRGQQGRLYNMYTAQLPDNPNQLFQDYLKGQNFQEQFKMLAPSQRGETPSRFAPLARFIPRRF